MTAARARPMAPIKLPVLADRLGRPLRDLRISVTDRCNFRCRYCMPREHFGAGHAFLGTPNLLGFDEIVRVASVAAGEGVTKIRLTGGEPLLRPRLTDLVAALARALPDVDLALTTNGSLLARYADALRQAGLRRVTVSLDSLNAETFRALADTDRALGDVLEGIDAVARCGLPLRVNTVVRRGVNEAELPALAERFRGTGHVIRFIEYMDVGTKNGWRRDDVVTAREIVERIGTKWPLEPVLPARLGEVARRWRYRDGAGEIGVIASVSEPFCRDCVRARLSADGRLFTCLFATSGTDLRAVLRSSPTDEPLRALLRGIWSARVDRYSELRAPQTLANRRVEMSYIGG